MRKLAVILVCLSVVCFFVQGSSIQNVYAKPFSEHSPAEKAGLVAGSVFSSAVYFPFKAAYAILGGITSGLTYGVSLGKEAEAANKVAVKSFTGDWYIHPNILTGDEELNFTGPDDVSP
ncbi:MAG: hypothetical protein ACE5KZ_00670 [Candidatus Scalinduaceae bacterium]